MKKNILIPFLAILLFSCKKEATSWNTDWQTPLINDTLSLKNYVNDSTLSTNSSTYSVDLTRTILDLGVEDIVSLPDTSIEQTFKSVFISIQVPPGFSFVNDIQENKLEVKEVELKKIHVSHGTINLTVYNPLNTTALFTVMLPGVTKNGVNFQQNFSAPGGSNATPGTASTSLDLAGYDIDLTGTNGNKFNILRSQLIIKSDPNGQSTTLTNTQLFRVKADFKDIKVDYARGYFGNTIISNTTPFNFDLFNSYAQGTLNLTDPHIQLLIENGMKMEAKASITLLSNTNATGSTVTLSSTQLNSPFYLESATGTWNNFTNSTQTIAFDASNSNIKNYLENLGNKHTVGYQLQLNPWGNTSGGWNEIFPTSRLKVKFKAQMPLTIGMNGLLLKDTFNLDLQQNFQQTHIESGYFVLNATNAFPFSTGVKLYLLAQDGTLLHTVMGSSDILSSVYGAIDPKDGKLKKNSEVKFILNDAVLSDLAKTKKVAVETSFNTPDVVSNLNESTSIPFGAFLAVKLKAKLNLKAIN